MNPQEITAAAALKIQHTKAHLSIKTREKKKEKSSSLAHICRLSLYRPQ
jgi:hypothetical protein